MNMATREVVRRMDSARELTRGRLCTLALLAALATGSLLGCATPTRLGPWSEPVVKGKQGIPKPPLSDAVKNYWCLEPTKPYPVQPSVTCI